MDRKIINCSKRKVYYNISIPHNDLISNGGSPTPAVFEEVRDEPLFKGRPCEWTMSVIRFTIPTSYIPIMYFPVQEDTLTPLNPNKSIFSITLSYNGNDFRQFLEWIPQVKSVPVPPPPTGITERQFQYDPKYLAYYGLFNYDHFCTIINNALETCFINNIVPLLPAFATYEAPYFQYNSETRLFSLFTQSTSLDSNALPVEIWSNTYLNDNFDNSFDQEYYSYGLFTNGKNVRYVIKNRGVGKITTDTKSPDGFIYEQRQTFPTLANMQSFTSIVIRSVSLPIVNEILTLQPNKGNRNGVGDGSGSESIISDFEVDIGSGNLLKPFIHYIPTAEYRRINLQGETPIQRIDIEILWKDNYDNLYPVYIPAHDIATIKIIFEET